MYLYENEKITKPDSQLPIDPDPQGSLIGLRLKIDYPNLQSTVYMKMHNFWIHKIKIFSFMIFPLLFFINVKILNPYFMT